MKVILKILLIFFPWPLRRILMVKIFKYKIHPSAKIGFAFIYPKYLEMGKNTKIDHLTVAVNLDRVILNSKSRIGRSNWITGTSSSLQSKHFKHQVNRVSELILGEDSAITKHHHLDCTNTIIIGAFATIAGYNSQFLTHSINVFDNRQDSAPIVIGDYTFVGTNVVILGGATLPSYSVLGAKSLLNKAYVDEWKLYGGSPAKPIKDISKEAKYFNRKVGFIE